MSARARPSTTMADSLGHDHKQRLRAYAERVADKDIHDDRADSRELLGAALTVAVTERDELRAIVLAARQILAIDIEPEHRLRCVEVLLKGTVTS